MEGALAALEDARKELSRPADKYTRSGLVHSLRQAERYVARALCPAKADGCAHTPVSTTDTTCQTCGVRLALCNGEAHANPMIDHCMICLPGWGWTLDLGVDRKWAELDRQAQAEVTHA